MGYRPISDYAIIGNDDRCALVASNGSIDWCCFPTVAAESVFGRLLDAESGGHFAIDPTEPYESSQAYRSRTNVLETRFRTGRGTLTLTDFMPLTTEDRDPAFQRAVYRHLRCEEGTVGVQIDFKPRFDYARSDTSVSRGSDGFVARGDGDRLQLQTTGSIELEAGGGRASGNATLSADESCWFVTRYNARGSISPSGCRDVREKTVQYWREWSDTLETRAQAIAGDEPWVDPIVRSGLVLKLLINEGSGAIYAAGTTSLPEVFGGSSNWDYRYNWIRDAKFTVQALFNLGQTDEAHRYFEWFRELSHDGPEAMQPAYGVHGGRDLEEETLDHLAGYRFSQPVRIGNAAANQRQLDMYGAIIQGIYETLLHDERLTDEDWASIRSIVDHVGDVWTERDAGIWEYRGEPRHYVHSKLLCWVALDRGIQLAEYYDGEVETDRWESERSAVRESIESRGYSRQAGSFVQHYETDDTLDATSLLIPIYEFLPPDDDRVESTIDTVLEELVTDAGLVERTSGPDSRPEGPGAFLFSSFWLVDALVVVGRHEKAREIFSGILAYLDPPYLMAERIDPRTGTYFGNTPQAFSHIGLINSAIYLRCAAEDHDLAHDPLSTNYEQFLSRSESE